MTSDARTPEEYMNELPEDRKEPMERLRKIIKENLPEGFVETMWYGMICYVVPLSRYPLGYLEDKKTPLPFMALASQKQHISLYHMGAYGEDSLAKWFKEQYEEKVGNKLDMGKSCFRFRNMKKVPYELIGEFSSKMTVDEWIELVEKSGRNRSR
jgi:uncharacterized protein YdhG (YjbR/CyaY superfamily)